MKCGKVKRMLGAYLDGELTNRKVSKVNRHLMECSACSWELKSLQKVNELGKWVANTDQQNLYPWEDYIADLHGKLKKAKAVREHWIVCLYDRIRYSIPDFLSYWFWKLVPGLAFALFIIGIFLGVNYIRNNSAEAPQKINLVGENNSKQAVTISKTNSNSLEKQKEPESESQKYIFNFYLKEHKNAVIQQASYSDQVSQKSIEIRDNDVLYYDTVRKANNEWQGEAGLILRAPRQSNVPAQVPSTQAKEIANSHSLSLEKANRSVTFKVVAPETLYPGYLLESIKKLDGKNCLHVIYSNGINTLSIFEQSVTGEEKLHSSDFKEYIMYSKEGNDPANIIGWNSNSVSFTIIGNEDFSQLINITHEIQDSI